MQVQDHNSNKNLLCIGAIKTAHGLKGELCLKSYLENPNDILTIDPWFDDQGNRLTILSKKHKKGSEYIIRIQDIEDRNAADAMMSQKIFADRSHFISSNEEETLLNDLVGLAVKSSSDVDCGVVQRVQDFGGGVFLEFGFEDAETIFTAPYSKETVIELDFNQGFIVVNPEHCFDSELNPMSIGKSND